MCQTLFTQPELEQGLTDCGRRLISRRILILFLTTVCSVEVESADPKTASSDPASSNSETLTLNFDELESDGFLRNPVGRYPADQYREKHAFWIGSCQLTGTPEVGKNVVLTRPVAAFEVLGGRDQPFISPHNILVPAGGETYDLLLTFERAVTAVSIASDPYPETADVIRLLILEPAPRVAGLVRRFIGRRLPAAQQWSQNGDPLFPLLHEPTELFPAVEPGHVCGVRALQHD